MRYILILLTFFLGYYNIYGQDTTGSYLELPDTTSRPYQLEFADLQVYLQPIDRQAASNAMMSTNADSALLAHLSSASAKASVEIRIKLKSPAMVNKIYFKAGRVQGATDFLNYSPSVNGNAFSNPPSGVTIERKSYNKILIKIAECTQSIPFHLEVWLEDHDGNLSPIKTYSIQ